MRDSAEVVVVGLGVIGASIVFHLTERGAGRVIALDRGPAGEGMTRRSTGLVRTHYLNEPEARMALASLPYWHGWQERVGGDSTFVPSGALVVARPEDADTVRRSVEMLRSLGVNTRLLAPEEIADIQPHMAVEDLGPAAYEPDSGYCDVPAEAARSLAAAAIRLGADVREGVEAIGLATENGRVTGVRTPAGDIHAGAVVIAAGVWSDLVGRAIGVDIPIWRRRGQSAVLERPRALARGYRVTLDRVLGISTRPYGGDQALTTLTGGFDRPVEDPDDYDQSLDPSIATILQRSLPGRYPPFSQSKVVHGWAGLYDMSPDTRAILDRVPDPEGLYVACGFSGTGFKKAPAVGACMAELIVEGRSSTVDIHPFRWSRFEEDDPLEDHWGYSIPSLQKRQEALL